MKIVTRMLIVVAACMLLCGCVVRSLFPWLAEDTRVTDISIAGSWQTTDGANTATFTSAADATYNVSFVGRSGKDSHFRVSLNRVSGTLFLVVGPGERNTLDAITVVPAFLLFRVDLTDDTLSLTAINLDEARSTLKEGGLALLSGSSKETGFIVLSRTHELESFVEANFENPDLFDEKPMYIFSRKP